MNTLHYARIVFRSYFIFFLSFFLLSLSLCCLGSLESSQPSRRSFSPAFVRGNWAKSWRRRRMEYMSWWWWSWKSPSQGFEREKWLLGIKGENRERKENPMPCAGSKCRNSLNWRYGLDVFHKKFLFKSIIVTFHGELYCQRKPQYFRGVWACLGE